MCFWYKTSNGALRKCSRLLAWRRGSSLVGSFRLSSGSSLSRNTFLYILLLHCYICIYFAKYFILLKELVISLYIILLNITKVFYIKNKNEIVYLFEKTLHTYPICKSMVSSSTNRINLLRSMGPANPAASDTNLRRPME